MTQLQLILLLAGVMGAGLTLVALSATRMLAASRARRIFAESQEYERHWEQSGLYVNPPPDGYRDS